MKNALVILGVVALSACSTAKNDSESEVKGQKIQKNKSLLVCSNPQLSDDGYKVTFDMKGTVPVTVVAYQVSRAGTTQLGERTACSKIASYDPQMADGAQPQYACTISRTGSSIIVVLTDGDRAGKRYASLTASFNYGSLPMGDKLSCVDASK